MANTVEDPGKSSEQRGSPSTMVNVTEVSPSTMAGSSRFAHLSDGFESPNSRSRSQSAGSTSQHQLMTPFGPSRSSRPGKEKIGDFP
ncbi:hypothetical protein Scep_010441 [Stephania cephalantha]|uniref:Uncharacterized protein n=1 Tax=Stephania cephalantha TaxID=152367 RepID=A0AAP0JXA1_9MAGN